MEQTVHVRARAFHRYLPDNESEVLAAGLLQESRLRARLQVGSHTQQVWHGLWPCQESRQPLRCRPGCKRQQCHLTAYLTAREAAPRTVQRSLLQVLPCRFRAGASSCRTAQIKGACALRMCGQVASAASQDTQLHLYQLHRGRQEPHIVHCKAHTSAGMQLGHRIPFQQPLRTPGPIKPDPLHSEPRWCRSCWLLARLGPPHWPRLRSSSPRTPCSRCCHPLACTRPWKGCCRCGMPSWLPAQGKQLVVC